ncbi:hypothetical protein AGMMS50225_01970 [Betaproteobacteria bacterium]|nr:hypothetical protein AGMMS50225_01970 [Betaproteobacteria bacterium]
MSDPFISNVAAVALGSFDRVMDWLGLSGGRMEGANYCPLNPTRADSQPGSLSINKNTGVWAEFAGGSKGGDLVSLAAYIRSTKNLQAARDLAELLGISLPDKKRGAAAPWCNEHATTPIMVNPDSGPLRGAAGNDLGLCLIPVPDDAPPPKSPMAVQDGRRGRHEVRYTYRTADGRIAFYVDRYAPAEAGGKKQFMQISFWTVAGISGWKWKAPPAPRPLYGLDLLAARTDAPVIVTEGEKDCEAARALFPDCVVICWPGGAQAVDRADWQPLAGRVVTLWPDLDTPGRECMAKLAGILASVEPAAGEVWELDPAVFGLAGDGDGAADVKLDAAGVAEVVAAGQWRKRVDSASLPPVAAPLSEPPDTVASKHDARRTKGKQGQPQKRAGRPRVSGYFDMVLTGSDPVPGLYLLTQNAQGENVRKWLCSPFVVDSLGRDADGNGWAKLAKFCDLDGKAREVVIPAALLLGENFAAARVLSDCGLRIGGGKDCTTRIIEYIGMQAPEKRFRIARRTGWQGSGTDRAFVLPDTVIGGAGDTWRYEPEGGAVRSVFQKAGTLEDWKNHVGLQCRGNSRLLFAVSLAFAGPLLEQFGMESGGFHFWGGSSQGKTVLQHVASSVCGGMDYMQSWRTTDNALETTTAVFCDSMLALNEIGEAGAKVVGPAIYMLGNGVGKARSTRTGEAKARQQWRVLVLSSGEVPIATFIREGGGDRQGGT